MAPSGVVAFGRVLLLVSVGLVTAGRAERVHASIVCSGSFYRFDTSCDQKLLKLDRLAVRTSVAVSVVAVAAAIDVAWPWQPVWVVPLQLGLVAVNLLIFRSIAVSRTNPRLAYMAPFAVIDLTLIAHSIFKVVEWVVDTWGAGAHAPHPRFLPANPP